MNDGVPKKILALATGHELSVALFAGAEVLAEKRVAARRGQAELLLPTVAAVLGDTRPAAIVVEVGPGSFTGLRVGIAAARALALAWKIPLHGMRSTLMVAAAARAAGRTGPLQVALAAPRGQTWVENFGDGLESVALPVAIPAGVAPPPYGETIRAVPQAAAARFVPERFLQSSDPLYIREAGSRSAGEQ